MTEGDVLRALNDTVTDTAVYMAQLAGLDWACDMDEEAREAAKEVARKVHRRIATRLGVTL